MGIGSSAFQSLRRFRQRVRAKVYAARVRIVMVNWAPVEKGAAEGGGANGYAQQLALEMVARGHEVHWLSSGRMYEDSAGRKLDMPPPVSLSSDGDDGLSLGSCFVRPLEPWRGIKPAIVVNSPVRAPSLVQFDHPSAEVSSPVLERVVREWFAAIRPDLVHVHNLEGFSIGCVDAARQAGARVVFSLHNYHTVCPQVYLMQGHRKPCKDYRGGLACVGCATAQAAAVPTKPPVRNPDWPDAPLRPGPWSGVIPDDWAPLDYDVAQVRCGDAPANEYGVRRDAMVAMLNRCDRVLAVSEFVRSLFVRLGVRGDVIQRQHIGTRMAEIAAIERVRRQASSRELVSGESEKALRLVFLGYHNYYKGLQVLLDALELMTPEYLRGLALSVHAMNAEYIERPVMRLKDRLSDVTLAGAYAYEEIPKLMRNVDLGVVPSVWWDNGPQTVMEFLACGVPVLGARVGGIPDLVRHEENGLLFRGNDRFDLARTLVWCVKHRACVRQLARNVRPPQSMASHADEMERLYRELEPRRV